MRLRDTQKVIVAKVQKEMREHSNIVIELATGAGKTAIGGHMALKIAAHHQNRRGVALFLVHRRELVRQTIDTLRKFGLGDSVGVIASGYAPTPWMPVQVASVQSIHRRLGKLVALNPELVVIDEAHHIRAKTWEEVLDHFRPTWRIGLTATPARLDGKGLDKWFTSMVNGPSIRELVDLGQLAPCRYIRLANPINMDGIRQSMGDYAKGQMDERVTGPVIAQGLENYMRYLHAENRPTIHYAVSVRHSQEFVAKALAAGISAAHVDGDTPEKERDRIMRRFEDGTYRLLSNVDIVTEGFDAPECSGILLGRPTKSLTLYRQMCGRCMRPKADGGTGMIVDLAGNFFTHGAHDAEAVWSLKGGVEITAAERRSDRSRLCECGYLKSPGEGVCPQCGFERPTLTAREAELEMMEETNLAAAADQRSRHQRREDRRQIMRRAYETFGDPDKLNELREELGFKKGWIGQMIRVHEAAWGEKKRRDAIREAKLRKREEDRRQQGDLF